MSIKMPLRLRKEGGRKREREKEERETGEVNPDSRASANIERALSPWQRGGGACPHLSAWVWACVNGGTEPDSARPRPHLNSLQSPPLLTL